MGVGKIDNVNVIANAGAIRRFVIGSENLDMLFFPQCNLEHVWNQMRLTPVIFAELFRCAGGAEITKRNKPEPVNGMVQAENFLAGEIRSALGIDRALRRAFIEWHAVWLAG